MTNRSPLLCRLVGLLCLCVVPACPAFAYDVRVDKDTAKLVADAPVQEHDVHVGKDIAYGTADGKKLLLDVYQPGDAAGKRPGIVLIHGGGWMFGDKSFYEPLGSRLASKGYVAFSVNYRLAPAAHYPAQLDDVQRAVRWIRAHAATYNLDPQRLGALGDSAGGHLSAFLGTRDTRDNSDSALAGYSSRVECVVDFYGPTDFTMPASSAGVSKQAVQILVNFFGKTQEQAPDLYRDGSPIVFVTKDSAPFLIIHGTADPLVPVDQSTRFADALKSAGVPVTLLLAYKYGHGFLNPKEPKEMGAAAEDFFDRYLKPEAKMRTLVSIGNVY